jgi:hypothetical protein
MIYSSLTLFLMGCLAIALSILFRLKFKVLKNLSDDLPPNVFDKSFVVFNPYSEQRKVFHEFLSFLPFIVGFTTVGFALALMILVEAGFVLSFCVALFGLNLIVIDDGFEVYENSNTFIRAVQKEAKLGVGDLKVLQLIKEYMPKVSNYYLVLSITFMGFSIVFPYLFPSAIWLFAQFIGLILQVSRIVGVIAWVFAVFLFALTVVFVQILASKIKSRVWKHFF